MFHFLLVEGSRNAEALRGMEGRRCGVTVSFKTPSCFCSSSRRGRWLRPQVSGSLSTWDTPLLLHLVKWEEWLASSYCLLPAFGTKRPRGTETREAICLGHHEDDGSCCRALCPGMELPRPLSLHWRGRSVPSPSSSHMQTSWASWSLAVGHFLPVQVRRQERQP